jgi:hypothetical protein
MSPVGGRSDGNPTLGARGSLVGPRDATVSGSIDITTTDRRCKMSSVGRGSYRVPGLCTRTRLIRPDTGCMCRGKGNTREKNGSKKKKKLVFRKLIYRNRGHGYLL